jgi:hypothetical protein
MGVDCTAIAAGGGNLRIVRTFVRLSVVLRFSVVLPLALVASACGSSGPGASCAGGGVDAGDASADTADAATDGASGDAPDGGETFTLGLVPPKVNCHPYAATAPACALRVRPGPAPAGADGLSWATAFSSVQDALDRATCGCEVWIAGGTYAPTRSLDAPGAAADPRNRSFVLWPNARVYGGFAGNEVERTQRPFPAAETILSGDLGVAGARDDDAYHVVIGADGAELNQLTIRDGEADGLDSGQGVGAGLFLFNASMTLRDVAITDNDADSGAGIFADEGARLHLQGCTLARNTSNDGGALVVLGPEAVVDRSVFSDNVGVFSGPAITDFADVLTVTYTRFLRNRGDSGGALTVSGGHASFEGCWFEGNQAGSFGGAMLVRFGASARLTTSVLFANGSVGFGGALAVWTGTLELERLSVVGNTAAFGGAFLVKDGSTFKMLDSVVWRSADDQGLAFKLDGDPSTIEVINSDVPPEVVALESFEADPRLRNIPFATRFAVRAGAADRVPVTGAENLFTSGDRIELGDDGLERHVTAVSGDDVSFTPPLDAPAPRFLRVDLWLKDAPSLDADLMPTLGSRLIDAASVRAPTIDVFGFSNGAADIGAIEFRP